MARRIAAGGWYGWGENNACALKGLSGLAMLRNILRILRSDTILLLHLSLYSRFGLTGRVS